MQTDQHEGMLTPLKIVELQGVQVGMSFGSTPDTLLYEMIAVLVALPACLLLLVVGNLLRRLSGVQSPLLGLLVTALPLVGAIVGTSLYLDNTGVVASAQVLKKTESIDYRKEGDWRHHYQVQVQYAMPDGTTPAATFSTTAAVFDALHEGSKTAVRTVSIHGWFNLARLADQSTWTWIPWNWVAIGIAVLLLGWVGWQFLRNKVGCALLLLVAVVIFITPFVFKFIEWQSSENPNRTPLRATGVVTEVRRVTEIDPLPDDGHSSREWDTDIEAVQPYDIVVIRYTPVGHEEPVLGVDAIDVGSQVITPTMSIDLAYAATDPRAVRIVNGTHSHHWKNPVEWLKQQALAVFIILAFLGLLNGLGRWFQRFLRQRTSAVLPK